MAPRANWKGHLRIGELSAAVALYTAASTSERIAFHTINRATGNRVERHFVDSETGDEVERDEQVKGYDTGSGDPIIFEPDEIAAAVPDSDKMLTVSAFFPCDSIDDVFLDRPYYLAPADPHAQEAFALIRDGLRAEKVAALAEAVLFRRVRLLLIRPYGDGLVATTLNFDYEVRGSDEIFADIPRLDIKGEMLELAEHIIKTKSGSFDPAAFDDRYEAALAELVKAKIEGRKIAPPKPVKRTSSGDLLAALRESAGAAPAKASAGKSRAAGGKARKSAKTADAKPEAETTAKGGKAAKPSRARTSRAKATAKPAATRKAG